MKSITFLAIQVLIPLALAFSAFSQDAANSRPRFPFQIVQTIDDPVVQIFVQVNEEDFNRKNLIQLFSYLESGSRSPLMVDVGTDVAKLRRDATIVKTDGFLTSSVSWDENLRARSNRLETFDGGRSAFYFGDNLTKRFNYDLPGVVSRFAVVTLRDKRPFAPTDAFLLRAVIDGYYDAVDWWVKRKPKANLNATDSENRTPLAWSLWLHHNEILKLLVDGGADIQHPSDSGLPLFTAVDARNVDGARILIDAGAKVDVVDDRGATPIIAAAVNCDYAMVRLLIEKGANPEKKNQYGKTAIDYSCSSSSIRNLLRRKGGG